MKETKIYIACDSPRLSHLRDAAHLIALQKGCDPERVAWPVETPAESGVKTERFESELWVCQKQFRKIAPECDVFVAIVDGNYSGIRVEPPSPPRTEDGIGDWISPLHFEIVVAQNTPNLKILVFTLGAENKDTVRQQLSVRKNNLVTYETDKEFKSKLSLELADFRQGALEGYLASLHRTRVSVTCRDQKGLLERVSEVITDLKGNLAGGRQITRGEVASLDFVAEWTADTFPENRAIEKSIRVALDSLSSEDGAILHVERLGLGKPEISTLLTYSTTFVDQPGIAEHIFTTLEFENISIFSTQLDTFLSGGIMLGRIEFSLDGAGLSREFHAILAERLRKLPGVLLVDRSALEGRYWR